MGRKPTKCPKKCPKHLISLKAITHSAYFSREVHVSFCPPTLNQHPVFPTFNRDRKHYTSSFIHRCEQEKYEKNDALYKAQHDRFCQEQLNDKSKMLQPKPRSKNQYCHVCKDHYDDYLNHITSSSHKQCVQRNKFSDHIDELIDMHFPKRKEEESHLSILSSEELVLEKELSLATVPSSLFGQTINEPRFCDQFKQFGRKGVFGLYYEQNDPNRILNTKQFGQRLINNEEEGRIIFSPQLQDKNHRVQKIQQPLI